MIAPLFAVGPLVWLTDHWFRLAILVVGLVLLGVGWSSRRRPGLAWSLGGVGFALALIAVGGLADLAEYKVGGSSYSLWVFSAGALLAVLLVSLLLLTGSWSPPAAWCVPLLLLPALGGWMLHHAERDLADVGESVAGMRFRSPWWLGLLALVPVILLVAWRRLSRHEVRPWIAVGLRAVGVAILAVALAEPFFNQPTKAMTVLFVVDRTLSIPDEPGDDPAQPGSKIDLRTRRIRDFINNAVEKRGAGHDRDQAGLIIFGRQPRLELPPSETPRFNLTELAPADDPTYTNIGAAIKLGLASYPEGTGKRMVLITDGNENLGDAEEQARLAKTLGVQIDVLPLAAGQRNTEEVLVERVDAPAVIEQGARVPIRVLVRSHNPNLVVGRVILRQITDKEGALGIPLDKRGGLGVEVEPIPDQPKGARITKVEARSPADRSGLEVGEEILQVDGADVAGAAGLEVLLAGKKAGQIVRLTLRRNPIRIVKVLDPVRLRLGLNPFSFDRPITDEQRSYTYEAEFVPLLVEDEKGKLISRGLPGDRTQNNKASTHVVARGQGRILLLENKAGEHERLVQAIVDAGKGRFKVVAEPVDILDNYKERDKLAVFLSNFDCIILANVPADRITEEHQEVMRSNTHDQGCGLVMIGGPESFGAGGWQKTPIEKALPVDSEIRSLKVQGKGGLVMIMHASEMARGNFWQKKIGKLAVERLGPNDEVGVVVYDFNCKWHIPMQEVGPNKVTIQSKMDKLSPGDMPDFDPALQLAFDALMKKEKDFGAKHIIIISDGDPQQQNATLLKQIRDNKITVATIGVATHGAPQDSAMAKIASPIGGTNKRRYYKVTDPKQLPAIYIKESRLVSQAFVYRKGFTPRLVYKSGPTAKLAELLPLGGFVRTTAKDSPLVEVPIVSPPVAEQEFPILAHWNYGLGKAVAFTSDAGLPEFWSRPWVEGAGGREGIFAGFWEQLLGYVLRPVESGRLVMNTEYRDGKIRVVVEAKTADGKPDTALKLRGGLTAPAGPGGAQGGTLDLRFTQKSSGQYEAEVKAEQSGSYFLNAQATRVRKVTKPGEKEREVEEGTDSVRAGVTLPYSPEFADLESNLPLLERIRDATGGRRYEDDEEALAEVSKTGLVFREPDKRAWSALPFHYWLLFLATGLLLADVTVRRLAFDADQTRDYLWTKWARLRGLPLPPPSLAPATGRLRARAPSTDERGANRFEGVQTKDVPIVTASGPIGTTRRTESPSSQSPSTPDSPAKPGGLDDLLEAKKRLWEDRDKT